VSAYVIEGSQHSLTVSHEDDALADNIQNPKVARRWQLFFPRHTQPFPAEDALLFERVDIVAVVPIRGQRLLESTNG
jgi:hypothetical protein